MGTADIKKVAAAADAALGAHISYGYVAQAWIGRLRFHLFLREEKGEAYHDHPWGFVTFPLRSYVEQVFDPVSGVEHKQVVPAFRFSYRPATHIHRIIGRWNGEERRAKPGWVPTIVWRGRHEREWCYWRTDGKRPHAYPAMKYLAMMERRPEKDHGSATRNTDSRS